jgi:hypothetical protein
VTQTPYDAMSTPTWGTGTPAPGASASTDLLDPTTRKFAGRKREVTVRIDYCSGTLDDGEDAWRRVLDTLGATFPWTSDQEGFNAHYQWSRKLVDEVSGRPIVTINRGLKSNPDDHRVHLEASGASGGLVYAALRSTSTAWLPSRIDVALDVRGNLDHFTRLRTTFDRCLPTGKEAIRIGTRKGVQDPGLTWMFGKGGQQTMVRWYRKGPQSRDPHLIDVNRLEFQFRPQDMPLKRALSRCNDAVDVISLGGPQWAREIAAKLIGTSQLSARVVAAPVTPPQSDDRLWTVFLTQYAQKLDRKARSIDPADPQSGWNRMYPDILKAAASSAARRSGRNPVWDRPGETAFSAKLPDRSTEPARLLREPAQGAPEHPSHQMVAGHGVTDPRRPGVVPVPGAGKLLSGPMMLPNRGGRRWVHGGWTSPGMTDPGRVLNMMGIGVPERMVSRLIGAIAGVDPARLAG